MTILPLLATLTALLCGPLLYALARRRPAFLAFLDGFVLVSIAGLVLFEVLPGAYGEGGAWSLAFMAAGALGPSLVENTLHRARREAHLATLALAVLGLLLHSIADGAAMTPGQDLHEGHGHGHEALGIAIIVHSIPVGLVVWWVMAPVFGRRLPAATIALMCAGTVAGFFFGLELNEVLGAKAFAWFQALVAGSILHVVFGRPHLEEGSQHRETPPPFEGLGNLFALAGLMALHRLDPHAEGFGEFIERFSAMAYALAPAILLGYALLALLRTRNAVGATPSDRVAQGLRDTRTDGIDRSAAWVLASLVLLTLLLPYAERANAWMLEVLAQAGAWPALNLVSLVLLGLLFVASLLRCGSRRWVALGLPGFAHGPAHHHDHPH